MNTDSTFIANLIAEARPPEDGILSRTIHNDDRIKAVLFGFGTGQELSEHTASMPATLQFFSGSATLTLGDETREAGPGTFAHMPAGMPHSIRAIAPTVMLLVILKG